MCGSLHHPSPALLEIDINEDVINKLRRRKEKEDAARTKASKELASCRERYEADLARLREASGTHGTATEAMDALDDVISRVEGTRVEYEEP